MLFQIQVNTSSMTKELSTQLALLTFEKIMEIKNKR